LVKGRGLGSLVLATEDKALKGDGSGQKKE